MTHRCSLYFYFQHTVALSTTEAEYSAITQATCDAMWFRNFFIALGFSTNNPALIYSYEDEPTLRYSDNQSAIKLTQNPQFHAHSRHFDIESHFVCEKVEAGIIQVQYCPTNEMVADIFTKALPRVKHEGLVAQLGLLPA